MGQSLGRRIRRLAAPRLSVVSYGKTRLSRAIDRLTLAHLVEALESRRLLATSVIRYHNNIQSTGLNSTETQLTPANVTVATFSKHYATALDGQAYSQPLYVPNLNLTGGSSPGPHNVVFATTQHDSLYAIDADSGAVLYKDSFIGLTNGLPNATSVTTMPQADTGSSDITPEIGITSTPVIDLGTNSLYLTAKTKEIINNDTSNPHYVYRLYKVNILNGQYSGTIIGDTIRNISSGAYTNNTGVYAVGTGDGSIPVSGQFRVYFNAMRQMNRPGLVLYNGEIYTAWASHGDQGPYHGWVIAFNASTLAVTRALNTTPNGGLGGIWQGGGIVAIDPQGFFYFETGNGSFNTSASNFDTQGFPKDRNYGDCFVKLALDPASTITSQNGNGFGLKVVDYFSPFNNSALNGADRDLGSGGPMILPDSAGNAAHPHLLIGSGKEAKVYLIDRDNMGKFDPVTDHVVQSQGGAIGTSGCFSTPAWFNGRLYYAGVSTNVRAFTVANASFTQVSISSDTIGTLCGTPSISANGNTNGLVWLIDRTTSVVKCYDAANLSQQVWTSAQAAGGRDAMGTAVKFTVPTVADGLVFVGTNNSLVVYGPPVPPNSPPASPTSLNATAISGITINLAWQDNANNEDGFEVYQSTDNVNFTRITTLGVNTQAYAATNLQVGRQYWFKVRAYNSFNGTSYSNYTNTATAITDSQSPNLDFSAGFVGSNTLLNFNGSAKIVGTNAELTDGGTGQFASLWSKQQQDIRKFNTSFSFLLTNATADGFTFAIQRSSNTIVSNAGGGGGLGYQGILTSIGMKFDLYNNISETGLYQNGAAPDNTGAFSTTPNVNLHSSHVVNANFSYNGTTLIQTLTDTVSGGVFTHAYTVNIPSVIGGTDAWVGFTASTGFFTAIQDIRTWTFVTIPSSPPTAPSGLGAQPASGTQINLAWNDNSANEDGFKIFRKTDASGTFAQVGTVPVNQATFMDTALTPDVDYYYQVVATNVAGDSTPSNTVLAHTPVPPITPSDAHPTFVSPMEIRFAWTDNANNEDGFKVLRMSGLGQFIEIADLPPNSVSYIDNNHGAGLTPGTEYDYHIQEYNVAGYSDFTGFTIATLTLAPAGLAANGSFGKVNLSWTEPSNTLDPGALTYNVYRGTSADNQGANPIATLLPSPAFNDTSAVSGATYYYVVTAVDSGGESAPSAETSASWTSTVTGTAAADAYYIRLDPAHTTVQIYAGSSATGTPAFTALYASLATLTMDLQASDDQLYIDLSNNSPIPTGGVSFIGGAGAGDTIYVIGGTTTAENVTFGPTSFTVNAAGGGTITYTSVEAASFDGKGGFDTLTINGGPNVSLPAIQHLASLTITAGLVTVPSGAVQGLGLISRTLSISGGGTLDLNDNDLIVDYTGASPLAAVQSLINAGRAGGVWTGTGITSSSARINPQHNTTLGAIEANQFPGGPTFDNITIDISMVLVKYTWYGDIDFNSKVDGADYARIDATFNLEATQGNIGGWFNGDLDGNGKVDGTDYALIDAAFNSQGAPLRPAILPPTKGPPARRNG